MRWLSIKVALRAFWNGSISQRGRDLLLTLAVGLLLASPLLVQVFLCLIFGECQ